MNKKTRGKEKDKKQGKVVSVLKGLGLSYVLTCIVFVICAFLLTYTDISMDCIPVVAIICTAISCVVGGIAASSSMENKGLLWGALTGALYAAILIVINITAGSESAGIMGKVTTAVCAMASGGIGGIIGINRK